MDFLNPNITPVSPEVEYHGPNTKSLKKMSRKQVIQDFLDVYAEKDMGKEIIRAHMRSDPKSFFDVLKKLIPSNLGIDAAEMLHIQMIDRYGNEINVSAGGNGDNGEDDEQAACSSRDLTLASEQTDVPQVIVHDRFEGHLPTPQVATGSNLAFDFTL